MDNLTENEQKVIELLHETWNAYLQARGNHVLLCEFLSHIQICQQVIGKQALGRLPAFSFPSEDK